MYIHAREKFLIQENLENTIVQTKNRPAKNFDTETPDKIAPPNHVDFIRISPNDPLPYPIDSCLESYFLPAFSATRERNMATLPQIDYSMLRDWALAFNRKLVEEGTYEKPMSGTDSWLKHFRNWCAKTLAYQPDIDPNDLFTDKPRFKKQQNATVSTNQSTPTREGTLGGIKKSDLEEVFSRPRNYAGKKSPGA